MATQGGHSVWGRGWFVVFGGIGEESSGFELEWAIVWGKERVAKYLACIVCLTFSSHN